MKLLQLPFYQQMLQIKTLHGHPLIQQLRPSIRRGKVVAVKAGTTEITVNTVDGNKSAKCTLTVTES